MSYDYARDIVTMLDRLQEPLKARIAELEAERDRWKLAYYEACQGRGDIDWVRAEGNSEKRRAEGLFNTNSTLHLENAALRKALEELASTANSIYRNQQMSTQAVASALLDLIVRYATIPQPTPDTLEQSSPDGERAGNT